MYKPTIMVGDVFQSNSGEDVYGEVKLTITKIVSSEVSDNSICPSPQPLWQLSSAKEDNQWVYFTLERKVHDKTGDRVRLWWIRDHCHRLFTHDEESMLLYAESRLVDGYGKLIGVKMNVEDIKVLDRFKMEQLLNYGRIPFEEIKKDTGFPATHWVRFTDEAWTIVHNLRRQRSDRMIMKYYGSMASPKDE